MNPVENLTLHRTSTAQQVADGLSDAIMRGEMPPGAPIRESAIAASLGISRNTVREAVRMLENGGLVRHTMAMNGRRVRRATNRALNEPVPGGADPAAPLRAWASCCGIGDHPSTGKASGTEGTPGAC